MASGRCAGLLPQEPRPATGLEQRGSGSGTSMWSSSSSSWPARTPAGPDHLDRHRLHRHQRDQAGGPSGQVRPRAPLPDSCHRSTVVERSGALRGRPGRGAGNMLSRAWPPCRALGAAPATGSPPRRAAGPPVDCGRTLTGTAGSARSRHEPAVARRGKTPRPGRRRQLQRAAHLLLRLHPHALPGSPTGVVVRTPEGCYVKLTGTAAARVGGRLGRARPRAPSTTARCPARGVFGGLLYMFWSATAPAGPDPRVLAQTAIASMNLRPISIGIVPEDRPGSVGLVGMPVWLWAASPDQHTGDRSPAARRRPASR